MLIALGALTAASLSAAWAGERDRSPIVAANAVGTRHVVAVLHGIAAAAALPLVALLAADELGVIRAERPRSGLTLAAVAWCYLAGRRMLRDPGSRRTMEAGTHLVAAAGIAVAAPSLTGSVLSVGSATAVTASIAVMTGRPARSIPAWLLGVAFALLALSRAGVDPGDLHFWVFGIGVVTTVVSTVAGAGARRWAGWLQPPLAIGLLLIPTGLALALADRRGLAVSALTAAAVYTLLGVLMRTGGFTLPAAAMLAIAYAHLLEERLSPFEEPLMWLPLAAGFALGALVAPRPRWDRFDMGSGLIVAWLATAALAVVVAGREGDLALVMLATAGTLTGYAAARRDVWFWYAGLVVGTIGAAIAGTGWAALALAIDAAAVAGHATVSADRFARTILAPSAAVLAGASFWATGAAAGWSAGEAVVAILAGSAVLAVPATWLLVRPAPVRVHMWTAPLHGVAQTGVVAAGGIALARFGADGGGWWAGLSTDEAWLVLTVLATLEAAIAGIVGTVRREAVWVWISAGLVGAAYGTSIPWLDWTAGEAIGVTGIVTAAGAAVTTWRLTTGRTASDWVGACHWLTHAGAFALAVTSLARLDDPAGWAGFSPNDARLLIAVVMAGEAVVLGILGTRLRNATLVWGSVGCASLAHLATGFWAAWTPRETVGWTLAAAAAAAIVGTSVARTRSAGPAALWGSPLHALAQVGAAAAVLAAIDGLSPRTVPAIAAGICAGESVLFGAMAPVVPESWRPREGSAWFAIAAIGLALGATRSDEAAAVAVQTAAVVAAVALVVTARPPAAAASWRPALWWLGGGVSTVATITAGARFGWDSVDIAAVLAIAGAGLVAAGLRSGIWPISYVGMLAWLGSGLILGEAALGGNRHAYAVVIAFVLLVILEMERFRLARLTDAPDHRRDERVLAEWIVMCVPPVMALFDAVQEMGFALLLGVEAAVILLWALATEVRRRLLVGALGVVVAPVIPVGYVVADAVTGGISTGTMLVIGAIAAVVLITVGSVLERSRVKVGLAVRKASEVLERWE
jgi:hypothetical protein